MVDDLEELMDETPVRVVLCPGLEVTQKVVLALGETDSLVLHSLLDEADRLRVVDEELDECLALLNLFDVRDAEGAE